MSKFRDKSIEALTVVVGGAARQAWDEGAGFYTTKLEKPSGLAAGIDKWAVELEAISSVGWQLRHWAIEAGTAYPVFERAR